MTTEITALTPPAKGPWQWQTRVLLRSNEGDGYEIDQQVLVDGSVFFRDLFAVPRPSSGITTVSDDATTTTNKGDILETKLSDIHLSGNSVQALTLDEEIEIDASSADLTLFADLLHFTARFKRFGLPSFLQVTLEQAGVLLPLAELYDCSAMQVILRQTIAQTSKHMPWQVLVLACERNDVEMAQTAISNLTEKLIHDAATQSSQTGLWDNLSKLSGTWQLEFLRLYIPKTRRYALTTHPGAVIAGELDMRFAVWATAFNPEE